MTTVERALNYSEQMLIESAEGNAMLKRIMNNKLAEGIMVIAFENDCSYRSIDYDLSDEERRVRDYAEAVLTKISKEVM